MLGLKRRVSKTETVHVPLAPVEFSDDDKVALKGILRSPLFDKLDKQVSYRLVCLWLNKGCSDEFKDGWLACTSAYQNPPITIEAPYEDIEYCSMDIQEDD
jgi:hypothetical protein